MDALNFIKTLIAYETETEEYKKHPFLKFRSVEDKYLNGECELLVTCLYLLNNKVGRKIEIKQKGKRDYLYHYAYQDEDGFFYDINGKFETIVDLAQTHGVFDVSKIKISDVTFHFDDGDERFFKPYREKVVVILNYPYTLIQRFIYEDQNSKNNTVLNP